MTEMISAGSNWLSVDAGSGTSITYTTEGTTSYANSFRFVNDNSNKGISLGLYFRYVKSKMSKLQIEDFKKKVARLQQFIKDAEDLDQKALVETLQSQLVGIIDRMELLSTGIKYHISKAIIDKHRHNIYDWHEDIVGLCKLEDYPRVVPKKVKTEIAKRKKQEVFNEYWVLYIKAPGEEEVKTNKQKIREKDPILFGKLNQDDQFYYITDWIDKYCDLTLEKFISDVKDSDPEFKVDEIQDFNDGYICQLRQEIKERAERLKDTNQSNWREKMVEEDSKPRTLAEQVAEAVDKSWWKLW